MLGAMEADFDSKPAYRVMQNAVTQVSVQSLANRREVVTGAMPSLSVVLDDWPITDQKQSGRCWLFAGLNLLRAGAMKKMRLKEFEFSQNFLLFWDKLEKANYFLEAIIDTAASPIGDRTVDFLLQSPVADGGQWNMFVNLVRKYGLAPKSAMPESESSSNTRAMNDRLCSKLRQGAKALREMHAGGAGLPELRRQKREIMTAIHRILCIHLGTPPSRFDWQWKDSKKKFHRDLGLSPQQFASKYVTLPMDDYVTLVNDPRPTSPYGRVFTVGYLGNVVGGRPVRYLNVHIDVMKHIAMRTLQGGEPVWFGCDVIQQMDRDLGLWHANLRDYEAIYDTTFALDKASRLLYGHTCMTHAMLFTGVDVVAGKSRWWRVENSWGEKIGQKGFCLMSDSWFGEHMFEIAARRSFLPPALQRALTLPPIVLPPWDPMGSLAGRNSASNAGQQ
jgi:bleomycin hydrolase